MSGFRLCDKVIEQASAVFRRSCRCKGWPRAGTPICRQRELRHQQQTALHIRHTAVHLAGIIGEHAVTEQFAEQEIGFLFGIAAFGADQHHQTRADHADLFTFHYDKVTRANLRLPTCTTNTPASTFRPLSLITVPSIRTPPCSTMRNASEVEAHRLACLSN